MVPQPEESYTVVTHPAESKVDITKEQVSVEDKEGDEDENSTDEDENSTDGDETLVTLFNKRIKFFIKEVGWKALGLGTMKVFFDGNANGYLVEVKLDNNNSVCYHLVAKEQNVYLNDKDCLWSPIDYSTFAPVRRHFKAQFKSKHAANKFQKLFEEGQYFAEEYNISERDMVPNQS